VGIMNDPDPDAAAGTFGGCCGSCGGAVKLGPAGRRGGVRPWGNLMIVAGDSSREAPSERPGETGGETDAEAVETDGGASSPVQKAAGCRASPPRPLARLGIR
jgi:hypothetical protein